MIPRELFIRLGNFQREVHQLLARHETSKSRLVDLSNTYAKLKSLSIRQDDLLRQSLRCVENELYRAAHVMAWAALMDFIEKKILSKGFSLLHMLYPAWSKFKTLEELRENVPEYQLVECTKELKICSKTEVKALHGLLNKRNECAHPSDFYPELNESLGYISEIIKRLSKLQKI